MDELGSAEPDESDRDSGPVLEPGPDEVAELADEVERFLREQGGNN